MLRIIISVANGDVNNHVSLRNENAWTSVWSTTQSNSGVVVFALVWQRKAVISNSHCISETDREQLRNQQHLFHNHNEQ